LLFFLIHICFKTGRRSVCSVDFVVVFLFLSQSINFLFWITSEWRRPEKKELLRNDVRRRSVNYVTPLHSIGSHVGHPLQAAIYTNLISLSFPETIHSLTKRESANKTITQQEQSH